LTKYFLMKGAFELDDYFDRTKESKVSVRLG
jgi:hypothetical protein